MTTLRDEIRRLAGDALRELTDDEMHIKTNAPIIESAILAGVKRVLERAEQKLKVNIRGDGVTDDTQAMQTLIDYRTMTRELLKELD